MKKGDIAPSRYNQLSDVERANLRLPRAQLLLSGRLRSFNGPADNRQYYQSALEVVEGALQGFSDRALLLDGFVTVCNTSAISSKRTYGTIAHNLKHGLFTFVKEQGLYGRPLNAWPGTFGTDFALWLERAPLNRGKTYSPNTARKFYGEGRRLLSILSGNSEYAGKGIQLEPFPENPFAGAHGSTESFKAQGLSVLLEIFARARIDFLSSVERFRYAERLFQGPKVERDWNARGRGQWKNIDAVLWELKESYAGRQLPPFNTSRGVSLRLGSPPDLAQGRVPLSEANVSLFHAISKYHGGWRDIALFFQPTPEAIIAPMVLIYIYTFANTETLRAMRVEDFFEEKFLGSPRFRLAMRLNKERGGPYRRSFPIDDDDPAAPHQVLRFMESWTANIRRASGKYENRLFIFATNWSEIRPFATALVDGVSHDSVWKHNFKAFLDYHGLPKMNVSELRQTVIDFAWLITGNDIRSILALKGGSSEDVVRLHYRSDAFNLRAQQEIAAMQEMRTRQATRSVKIHHRGAPRAQDLGAATPGCRCADPFDSPIPGEKRGTLCGAFGQCPSCPLGSPILESAVSLGRLLQLREELKKASIYLHRERWIKVFSAVQAQVEVWLRCFPKELWVQASKLNLPPIGSIE